MMRELMCVDQQRDKIRECPRPSQYVIWVTATIFTAEAVVKIVICVRQLPAGVLLTCPCLYFNLTAVHVA